VQSDVQKVINNELLKFANSLGTLLVQLFAQQCSTTLICDFTLCGTIVDGFITLAAREATSATARVFLATDASLYIYHLWLIMMGFGACRLLPCAV
jgi:hypothetical protein